ncbi:unnamed protein product [Penicillium nalgiovense]|nr:unnamed protein product [Penicillium nalgiovense]
MPECRAWRAPFNAKAEILSWNAVPAPRVSCVHELFEAQVQSQPLSPAVCARDGEWTFSQLDNAAERLARFLRSMGVGPGSYVPLLFEKCGLAIIAMSPSSRLVARALH